MARNSVQARDALSEELAQAAGNVKLVQDTMQLHLRSTSD